MPHLEPHDGAASVGHNQFLELTGRAEIRVRQEVDLDQIALCASDGGQLIVPPKSTLYTAGREVEGRQSVGINPDPHGDLAVSLEGDPLNAG